MNTVEGLVDVLRSSKDVVGLEIVDADKIEVILTCGEHLLLTCEEMDP